MEYTFNQMLAGAPKLLTVSMLSLILVACGGGSSGSGSLDAGSLDVDGTTDIGDALDGNGSLDSFGLDSGESEGESDDGFVAGGGGIDSDGNGISDENENAICKGLPGTDEDSNTATWDDNCEMRAFLDVRSPEVGDVRTPFYNSTYSEGIQRVLFCSGAGGVAETTAAFADGFFGPNTGEAVLAFQREEGLAADGIVGPNTWSRLQAKVEDNAVFLGNEDNTGGNFDVFGVLPSATGIAAGIDCSLERSFLGLVSEDTFQIDGWRLTDVPGGTGVQSFSTLP